MDVPVIQGITNKFSIRSIMPIVNNWSQTVFTGRGRKEFEMNFFEFLDMQ